MNKPELSYYTVIRIERNSNNKKVLIFKCASKDCVHELRICDTPQHIARATGYCTACLKKKNPYGVIYKKLLSNASKKNIEVILTYEEFLKFTDIKNCNYCDAEIQWTEWTSRTNCGKSYNLDRKDSNLGYTKENCVVCCPRCNWVKNNQFTYDEFKLIGKVIKQIDLERKRV
jgi:hypothetical protein